MSNVGRSGDLNGIELLMDLESYEYSYYPRGSKGFLIAVSDPYDRAVMRQKGSFVERKKSTYFFLGGGRGRKFYVIVVA